MTRASSTFDKSIDPGADELTTNPPVTVAARVTQWTSNFIATAVVIVLALTVGRQLVSYWKVVDQDRSDWYSLNDWPSLESCALEFGNSPYQMQRTQLVIDRKGVLHALANQCRMKLEDQVEPIGATSPAEQKMIAASEKMQPLAQVAGKWRIYQMPAGQGGVDWPAVLGIRDDVLNSQNEFESRLVVWGMALKGSPLDPVSDPGSGVSGSGDSGSGDSGSGASPADSAADNPTPEVSNWTTYICYPSSDTRTLEIPIPDVSRRTLSIMDPAGAKLTGFSGGSFEQVIRHFDDWAQQHDWRQVQPWAQSAGTMNGYFESERQDSERRSSLERLQIRLSGESESARGLMVVSTKRKSDGQNSNSGRFNDRPMHQRNSSEEVSE